MKRPRTSSMAALLAITVLVPAAGGAETAKVLARAPYLGVACHGAPSTACDRVGLAVWLRRPARSVEATVTGRHFRLGDRDWSGPAHKGLRRLFAGFLRPAGLHQAPLRVPARWSGASAFATRIRVTVTYRDGTRRTVSRKVSLSPGWG
jgi:hypothetical protein